MGQKGTHTWDLSLQYHRCPQCGYIFENRNEFQYQMGKYQKEVECPRCSKVFTLTQNRQLSLGPFMGDPQPPEINWRN